MTDPNYHLAKQGDPDAIAIYLNEKLSDRGVTIRAKRKEEILLLAIAFETVGDRETLVDLVRQELTALEARSITKVQIMARQDRQKALAWEAEFDLEYPKALPKLDLSLALEEEDEETKDGLHGIGDVICDRYRILEILGQGGNGVTYAAEDLQQNKKVAIKALSLRHMNDWKQIELFEREAKVLSQLNHPAIPKYFDFFTTDAEDDRAFYIVQELAQGQNLAKLVEAGWRTNEKGVRKIAEQVLHILTYLHGLKPSVIHRDIKPHNLIYGNDGKVSLVDFGAVQDTYRSTMVRGSTVIGTFGYMAPEQFRGQAVPATDLYALGATILFLLTHRSPSELPQERLRYDFRYKIQVSEQFADWLQKMVEPDMDDRFTSAKQSLSILQSKRIVWMPTRKLSWKAWLAIAVTGSILTAFTITNKRIIMEYYNLYPKICLSQGNESSITIADIQELVEYVKQSKNLSNKFPSQANERDRCLAANFNGEILDILSQRGIQLDYNELLHSTKIDIVVDWLISKKIDINTKYKDNKTALSIAVYNYLYLNNNIDIFKLLNTLIKDGADINNRDNIGQTPLHYAAFIGDIKVASFLIKNSADINAKDNNGNTPLDSAFKSLYLYQHAKYYQHANLIRFNNKTYSSGKTYIISLLIKNGADTNNIEGVNAKDNDGFTPLHRVIFQDDIEAMKSLISNKANVNIKDNDGFTPLHQVIFQGDIEAMKLLITNKANINIKDNNGLTPLHRSIGNIEAMKLLIANNANVNIKDNNGLTPLHHSIFNSNIEAMKLLIANNASVNIKDNNGLTPLHHALAVYENIANKVNGNTNKLTPLEYNVLLSNVIETIKLLITSGADTSIKDNDGQTALCYLVKVNKKEILEILIKKGYDLKNCN